MDKGSSTIEWLYNLQFFGIKLGLCNILNLLEYYKIDYNSLKYIHLAGTNGKGSTANILNDIYRRAGYKVGLYTSPHILEFNERIKVDGFKIRDEELTNLANFFKEGIEKFKCTFFEATTAIAIKHFLDQQCELVVLETGLGGRYDATNIVTPLISVVTGVHFDHESILGNSLYKIAFEKAGIAKKGKKLVANIKNKAVFRYFKKIATSKGAFVTKPKRRLRILKKQKNGTYQVLVEYQRRRYKIFSCLRARYLAENFNLALSVITKNNKYFPVNSESIIASLENISIFGRMQEISKNPRVMIDAAHNLQGISTLATEIRDLNYKKLHLISGVLKDKNFIKILNEITKFQGEFYLSTPSYRGLEIEKLRKIISRKELKVFPTIQEAFKNALLNYQENDLIIVFGSHFILADLLKDNSDLSTLS